MAKNDGEQAIRDALRASFHFYALAEEKNLHDSKGAKWSFHRKPPEFQTHYLDVAHPEEDELNDRAEKAAKALSAALGRVGPTLPKLAKVIRCVLEGKALRFRDDWERETGRTMTLGERLCFLASIEPEAFRSSLTVLAEAVGAPPVPKLPSETLLPSKWIEKWDDRASDYEVALEATPAVAPKRRRRPPAALPPKLDKKRERVRVGKTWHDLTERQTDFLALLFAAGGDWVPGKEAKKQAGDRPDKLRKRLPPAVRRIVESNKPKGYRVRGLLP